MKCFKQSSKRWLAMALSLVMCLGLLQMPAMAAEGEVPAELGLTNINIDTPVSLKVGESATLLYAITVTGTEGANYTITDPTATPVDADAMTGTIDSTGEATVYVTQTIDIDDIVEGYVENTAYIQAGVNTDLIDTDPSASVRTQVNGEMVKKKTPDLHEEERTVDYEVEVVNKIGATLSGVRLVDTMPEGLSINKINGSPVYSIKLYDPDGSVVDLTDFCTASSDGQVTTWTVTGTINPDAKIVLSYQCSIADTAVEGAEKENVVNVIIRRAPVATGYGIIDSSIVVSDNGDDWEYAGTTSCVIIVPKAID